MTPVAPPTVKRKINPIPHASEGLIPCLCPPDCSVANQLNTLIPVGTAMHIVANEK